MSAEENTYFSSMSSSALTDLSSYSVDSSSSASESDKRYRSPNIASRRKGNTHTFMVATRVSPSTYEASPVRKAPQYARANQDLSVDESENMELMNYVHDYEGSRLAVYVPVEPVTEQVWFPERRARYISLASESESYHEMVRAPSESMASVQPSMEYPQSDSSESLPPPVVFPREPEPEIPPSESSSSSSSSEDVEIPEWLVTAANAEMIDPNVMKPFLREGGFEAKSMTTLLKANKRDLETFPVRVTVSPKAPVFRVENIQDNKCRLMLPDPVVEPHVDSGLIGKAFAEYGLSTSLQSELEENAGTMCSFHNLRLPAWFRTQSREEAGTLQRAVLVVRRALSSEHASARQNFSLATYIRPDVLPPPSVMNGRRRAKCLASLPDFERRQDKYSKILDDASHRLVTSRAVARFWKTEVLLWVTFWSTAKMVWKRKHLRLWLHPYGPDLIISDKDGGVMRTVIDYSNYSQRIFASSDSVVPVEVSVLNGDAIKMTYLDSFDQPDKHVWIAFPDAAGIKDFQQAVATVAFIKDRRKRVSDENLAQRSDYGLFNTTTHQTRFSQ
ncbi:hypothetical protein GNI_160260 [Gregarina niphandrodes]|uniref:Uncharacterized protein n=1 Tax=Gregarina niphandrodes TaxID=110365 RepID=A0A023AYL6_GRENI|nr:hypothetical protein GNI_160260 [Gregarina niphandrodes]EZG43761.1 hypothetical protein GNI_160260 [Gregarina niphandrodes]|eukprot:XP_011134632.1 hypothetical protein GNI_160260 [Gregarina niphandrodes]